MVYFQTKNPHLGKLLSVLQWKKLANVMAIWSILLQFRTFYGHLGIFCPFWYIVPKNLATLVRRRRLKKTFLRPRFSLRNFIRRMQSLKSSVILPSTGLSDKMQTFISRHVFTGAVKLRTSRSFQFCLFWLLLRRQVQKNRKVRFYFECKRSERKDYDITMTMTSKFLE
jgi:hypothetical protein